MNWLHHLGFGHPEGVTTGKEAEALAARGTLRACRRARRSPENYEQLYREYW